MARKTSLLLLLGSLIPLAALAGEAPSEVDVANGREEFRTYCVPCHGLSGVGDGPAADALKQPPLDLTRISARRGGTFPEAEVIAVIDGRTEMAAHGSREMPIWGMHLGEHDDENVDGDDSLSTQRIRILVAYLRSIQQ